MNKKNIHSVLLIFLLFGIGWGIFSITNPIGLTGFQWFMKQGDYVKQISMLADELDTVTTLYISDSISSADYLEHLSVTEKQNEILYSLYLKDEQENQVKAGTHNFFSKLGCECVKESYEIMSELITTAKNTCKDKDELSYKYLAYKQEVVDIVVEYTTAYYYLMGYYNIPTTVSTKNTEEGTISE